MTTLERERENERGVEVHRFRGFSTNPPWQSLLIWQSIWKDVSIQILWKIGKTLRCSSMLSSGCSVLPIWAGSRFSLLSLQMSQGCKVGSFCWIALVFLSGFAAEIDRPGNKFGTKASIYKLSSKDASGSPMSLTNIQYSFAIFCCLNPGAKLQDLWMSLEDFWDFLHNPTWALVNSVPLRN